MRIKVYDGWQYFSVEVSDEFAEQYAEMEHAAALVERKETRRHQSLERSIENGFDVADPTANVERQVEQNELRATIKNALHKLTGKQRTVLLSYVFGGYSFREIGERMGISKETAKEHFQSAVKKMKKFLKNTPSN